MIETKPGLSIWRHAGQRVRRIFQGHPIDFSTHHPHVMLFCVALSSLTSYVCIFVPPWPISAKCLTLACFYPEINITNQRVGIRNHGLDLQRRLGPLFLVLIFLRVCVAFIRSMVNISYSWIKYTSILRNDYYIRQKQDYY